MMLDLCGIYVTQHDTTTRPGRWTGVDYLTGIEGKIGAKSSIFSSRQRGQGDINHFPNTFGCGLGGDIGDSSDLDDELDE
jgi:hypothetical protein